MNLRNAGKYFVEVKEVEKNKIRNKKRHERTGKKKYFHFAHVYYIRYRKFYRENSCSYGECEAHVRLYDNDNIIGYMLNNTNLHAQWMDMERECKNEYNKKNVKKAFFLFLSHVILKASNF